MAELTVYPHIDDIVPCRTPPATIRMPVLTTRRRSGAQARTSTRCGPTSSATTCAVHWRSTARRDELMVRQDELPWQGRVTVLLDVRRNAHTPASLELAVSAAASIVTACWKRRDLVRFMTTDNTDFGYGAGTAHAEAIMEFLATVAATPSGTLRGVLDALGQAGNGGAVVPIVAGIADAELASLARLRGRFAAVTIVHFERSSYDTSVRATNGASAVPVGGTGVIRVTGERPFMEAWNSAFYRGARVAALR